MDLGEEVSVVTHLHLEVDLADVTAKREGEVVNSRGVGMAMMETPREMHTVETVVDLSAALAPNANRDQSTIRLLLNRPKTSDMGSKSRSRTVMLLLRRSGSKVQI
jgi:hypothetical protein